MSGTQFISESISPGSGTFSGGSLEIGAPLLPDSFSWRGRVYEILTVKEAWKTTGADTGGSRERYVRRHWYRVLVAGGLEMVIYFDRQQRVKNRTRRWWLYTKRMLPDS